jgi:hypothetical protein
MKQQRTHEEDPPSEWVFPASTSGCLLSLQLVDESLQFKKTPYFELLPPLILLVWRRR